MIVSEALSEVRGGILRDVSSLTSGTTDVLWTDARLCLYIDEAQKRFARKTLIIRDRTTPAVATIALTAGVSEYQLHSAVLATLSVRYDQDVADLPRASHITLDTRQPTDSPWFDVNSTGGTLPPGRPRAYSLDQAFRTLRVYPTPTAAEEGKQLHLRVARLPLLTVTELTMFDSLEIPEEYQIEMLEWAAYKALSNHDADAHIRQEGDPYMVAAQTHKTNFEAAVAEAIRDAKRNMFAPVVFDFANVPGITYPR